MRIDDVLVERILRRVQVYLARPWVALEASGRHVHLSRQAVDALFGAGYRLTKTADLSQPGQFVCEERVRAIGPRGEFSGVVVLGPERGETQVEISATDARTLGLSVPVRLSGSIQQTPGLRLAGPAGELELPNGVIVAARHIHMTPEDADRFQLRDGQVVSVRVFGQRATTFHDVILRVSPTFATYMHIDYDEANACGFQKGMAGVILP